VLCVQVFGVVLEKAAKPMTAEQLLEKTDLIPNDLSERDLERYVATFAKAGKAVLVVFLVAALAWASNCDNYLPVLETIQREVEAIEDRVFAAPLPATEVQRLHTLRRELLQLCMRQRLLPWYAARCFGAYAGTAGSSKSRSGPSRASVGNRSSGNELLGPSEPGGCEVRLSRSPPSPYQWHQPEPDFAHVVRVAREISCEELLFIEQPRHDPRDTWHDEEQASVRSARLRQGATQSQFKFRRWRRLRSWDASLS
jgi:hypothetical protein